MTLYLLALPRVLFLLSAYHLLLAFAHFLLYLLDLLFHPLHVSLVRLRHTVVLRLDTIHLRDKLPLRFLKLGILMFLRSLPIMRFSVVRHVMP